MKTLAITLVLLGFPMLGMAQAGKVYVQASPAWLAAPVNNDLNSYCSCLAPSAVGADSILKVTGLVQPDGNGVTAHVKVSAELMTAGGNIISQSDREWLTDQQGSQAEAIKLALAQDRAGISPGAQFENELARQAATEHAQMAAREEKLSKLRILVDPADTSRRAIKQASRLQADLNHKYPVSLATADVRIRRVYTGSATETPNFESSCASWGSSISCSDSYGGRFDSNCVGELCSSSYTAGDPERKTDYYAWELFDPRTGKRIGVDGVRKPTVKNIRELISKDYK